MAERDESICACIGWVRAYGMGEPGERHHRDCKHWHRERKDAEVFQTRTELIVTGDPGHDENHNCDAMGCTSVSHVVFRFRLADGYGVPVLATWDRTQPCRNVSDCPDLMHCGTGGMCLKLHAPGMPGRDGGQQDASGVKEVPDA